MKTPMDIDVYCGYQLCVSQIFKGVLLMIVSSGYFYRSHLERTPKDDPRVSTVYVNGKHRLLTSTVDVSSKH